MGVATNFDGLDITWLEKETNWTMFDTTPTAASTSMASNISAVE